MTSINYKQYFYNYLTRHQFDNRVYGFEEILKDAIRSFTKLSGVDLDQKVSANLKRHWNDLKKMIDEDEIDGIIPILEIVNDTSRLVLPSAYGNKYDITTKNKHWISKRNEILSFIDKLNDREYEYLSCYLCRCLSASKVLVTPPGNEGGIDFIAEIKFSKNSHFLFGTNGPIRIIGQSKMYGKAVDPSDIKEFNSTMNDVYSHAPKVSDVLPSWFKSSKGIIIPWFISHNGFKSGAMTRAKRYGIVATDSRMVTEQIALSAKFGKDVGKSTIMIELHRIIDEIKADKIVNPSLK